MNGTMTQKRTLTPEHLDALARGRHESAIVRRYLTLLESNRPRRGKKVSVNELKQRLATITSQLADCDPTEKLNLIKKRKTLVAQIERLESSHELVEAEQAFVVVASEYAKRKGIDFDTFREVGVPTEVLKRAKVA